MSEAAPFHDARAVPLRSLLGIPVPEIPPPPPDPDLLRAEGFAAGLAQGRGEAAVQRAADREEHRLALEAQAAMSAALLDGVAADLAGLALAIARAVLAAEPVVRAGTVAALVREALAAAPAEAGGTVVVNPAVPLPASLPDGWEAVADARVPEGEVRALLPPRGFHAALDRRLARVSEALGLGA